MTVHLLANPDSGRGVGPSSAELAAALRAAGATEVKVLEASSAAAAEELVRRTVAAGCARLVVAGGDGMVHLATQGVAGTGCVLGVVPVGTGNDFATALGISSDVVTASRTALGEPVAIDALRIGDRWAASIATLGFSAAVNQRANEMRFPKGSSRYTVATLAELVRLHATDIHLRLDGENHHLTTTLLTVANTRDFGGGMHISPDASPTDGVADLTLVTKVGRAELLWFFRKVFSGTHMESRKVEAFRARTIEVVTAGIEVWADGEPVATTPMTIEVVPGALLVAGIVPS